MQKNVTLLVLVTALTLFAAPRMGTMTDSRDGKSYRIVKIGKQTWMAENLNYDYNEGSAKSFCFHEDCRKYGRYYTWAAAVDSAAVFSSKGKGCGNEKKCGIDGVVRGVCPTGWHLPNKDEVEKLFSSIGGELLDDDISWSQVGERLKSSSGWKSLKSSRGRMNSGNGKDTYGFSALPAGSRYVTGEFGNQGTQAFFWTSSEFGETGAYCIEFFSDEDWGALDETTKALPFSVRCIKD